MYSLNLESSFEISHITNLCLTSTNQVEAIVDYYRGESHCILFYYTLRTSDDDVNKKPFRIKQLSFQLSTDIIV